MLNPSFESHKQDSEVLDDDDLGLGLGGQCDAALAAEAMRIENELRESMLPLDEQLEEDEGSNSFAHQPIETQRRDTLFAAHLPLTVSPIRADAPLVAPPAVQNMEPSIGFADARPMALDTKPFVNEQSRLPFLPAAAQPPSVFNATLEKEEKPTLIGSDDKRGQKRPVHDDSAIVIDSDSDGNGPSASPGASPLIALHHHLPSPPPLHKAPAPPLRKARLESGNGSANAPIAIDSDDEMPRMPLRPAGPVPIYLGAIPASVPFRPTGAISPVHVPPAGRLTLIRESRAVPTAQGGLELLIRVLLPAQRPGAEPTELGRLDWIQARFLWTLSAKEKILVQCIAREAKTLSVPHADSLNVALMLFVDPRAARWQDANMAPDLPTRRRIRAEHEQESAAWRDLFEQLFVGTAPNIRRVRDGSVPAVMSFDLGRFCQGDLGGTLLPETEPLAAMRLPLYAHQKQALSWMLNREREPLLVPNPLFSEYRVVDESGRGFWFNPTTAQLMFTPPSPLMMPRGGILADEMGLGKTISTTALIASNHAPKRSRATLVVCPLSMLNTWRDEILRAMPEEPKPRIRLFYGPQRISDPNDLANSDVVITTYSIIVSELKAHNAACEANVAQIQAARIEGDTAAAAGLSPSPQPKRIRQGESALYAIEWFRIVLDEAHTVRCKKTLCANAVFRLQAHARWCLTGTPIHNSLDDLFSLLHFLNTPVYGQEPFWGQLVSRPFQRKDKESLVRLNAVLQALMLRRMKTDSRGAGPLVQLPSKTVEIAYLDFSPAEAAAYKSLADASKERFKRLERDNAVLANFANVLEMLLRLRQLCDHPALLPNGYLSRPGSQAVATVTPELRTRLLELVSKSEKPQFSQTVASVLSGTLQQCVRCKDVADRPQLLPCGHVSCVECIAEGSAWDAGMATCGLCKEEFAAKQAVALPFITAAQLQSDLCGTDSTKLVALLRELKELQPDCKAVVFSQWTSMMDIIGAALDREGIRFARLDGSMPLVKRQRALDDFAKVPHIKVMLLSLKAGGLGLTLTSANRVYVFDPWWCPASEQQAIDRVHRLGQFRPVTVRRLIVNGTIEQRILQLQERKLLLARGAMASREEMRTFRLEELRLLFDM